MVVARGISTTKNKSKQKKKEKEFACLASCASPFGFLINV